MGLLLIPKNEPMSHRLLLFAHLLLHILPIPASSPSCPGTADPLPGPAPARAMLPVGEGRGGRGVAGLMKSLLGLSITSPARCRDSPTWHRALS